MPRLAAPRAAPPSEASETVDPRTSLQSAPVSGVRWVDSPRAWLVLALLGLVLYVPFLGSRDLWYPDEPQIAEVALAMYESGDWVAPRRMGEIWVDYPPMIYWTAVASAHLLGGPSELAIRLPSALGALGLVLATCFAGARWFGPRAGLWAGFLLLTFPQFLRQAVSYRPDVLFAVLIGAGLFVYARAFGPHGARWGPRIAAFALLGLAMLTKGPLGLLLPGLVLTLWHGARREWRPLLELAPLAVVSLGVYLPWFVACASAMGADSILGELYMQNFQRFFSGFRGHGRPVYYYPVRILFDLAPWSLALPVTAVWIARSERWRDRNVQLALWWCIAFLGFLSLAVTKRGVYLLPAYPAVALLLGSWLAAVGRVADERPARALTAWLSVLYPVGGLALLGIALASGRIAARLELDPLEAGVARAVAAPLGVIGLLLVAAGLWVGLARSRGNVRGALYRLATAHVPIYLVFLAWGWPAFNPVKTYAPQSRWIREQIDGEDEIGLVNPKELFAYRKMGAFAFYSGARVEVLEEPGEVARFLREHPRSVVLVEEDTANGFFTGRWESLGRHVVHRLRTASQRYVVVRGPAAGPSGRD